MSKGSRYRPYNKQKMDETMDRIFTPKPINPPCVVCHYCKGSKEIVHIGHEGSEIIGCPYCSGTGKNTVEEDISYLRDKLFNALKLPKDAINPDLGLPELNRQTERTIVGDSLIQGVVKDLGGLNSIVSCL